MSRVEYSPKLKELAGRLQALSFRDMNAFAELVDKHRDGEQGAGRLAECLLRASDEIAGTTEPLVSKPTYRR